MATASSSAVCGLQVLATPGHTPDTICILLYDAGKADPHALFSGDTLFIGDVGRPDHLTDLLGMSPTELGGLLYDSLHGKILPLPDETLVYPAHGAGSLCGKNMSEDTVSTIGVQRQYNYALQPMDKAEFVKLVTADQPDAPAYFSYDTVLNRQKRQTLEKDVGGDGRAARAERRAGLEEVTGRPTPRCAGSGRFRRGTPGGQSQHRVLRASSPPGQAPYSTTSCPSSSSPIPEREEEAAIRLGRIGFDSVAGYLAGGMQALDSRPDLLRRTSRITAATLAQQLADAAGRTTRAGRVHREGMAGEADRRQSECAAQPLEGRAVIHPG